MLFSQSSGLWKGRVWDCRQGAPHMKFSYIAPLAALRGTGQPLGGLTVDIGMFSEHFLLWKVWKAILSSNIRHLRLFFFFFLRDFIHFNLQDF